MITYLIHSLTWSLGGFLFGLLAGRIGREVIGDQLMPRHSTRRIRLEHLVGIVVVALAALTMLSAIATQQRLERVTQCQAQYNADYRRTLAERSDAAQRERDAQRALILAVGDDGADTQAALDDYRTALDVADQRRSDNPLPRLPTCP